MSIGSLSHTHTPPSQVLTGGSPLGGLLRQTRQPIKVGPGQEGPQATPPAPRSLPTTSEAITRSPTAAVPVKMPGGATTSPVKPSDSNGIRAGGILYEVA